MRKMFIQNATDVRKEWSSVADSVIREKPAFIKRTRDIMVLANLSLFENILSAYTFTADRFIEDDGSVTLSLHELDLIENGKDEKEAKLLLAQAILDYAEDFYREFALWSAAPNRKPHVPYVLMALILDDIHKMGDLIQCQAGEI